MTNAVSLQWAGFVLGIAGCSFIYNPDHINRSNDGAVIDAEIIADSDPTMLHLDSVAPALFYEGQGGIGLVGATPFGGPSRQAVLVISGTQIVKDQTSVAITVHAGEAKSPTVIVDNSMLDVAADGDMLAVPVTIPIDPMLKATDLVRFDVTVTQNTVNGPFSQTLSETADHKAILQVQGLAELTGVNAAITPSAPQTIYSYVDLTGTITAPAGPLILRSATSISIAGPLVFDAANQTPGVAGGMGGTAGKGGLLGGTGGGAGGGPNGGGTSGQPGKYKGTDQLEILGGMNASSGGAGGDGQGVLNGAAGGAGGGGGGSVEITAASDLHLAAVSAKGASGLTGAQAGGGGTGGVVLLRSGGAAMVTSVDVSSGAGSDPGRVRIDAPNTISGPAPSAYYRGPSFITATPMIVRAENAIVTIISQPQRNVTYYINNADGSQSHGPVTVLAPPNGIVPVTLDAKLFRGLNMLCAIVDGGSAGDQAGQCIQIAYLYSP